MHSATGLRLQTWGQPLINVKTTACQDSRKKGAKQDEQMLYSYILPKCFYKAIISLQDMDHYVHT
jgi:hypothetical protein